MIGLRFEVWGVKPLNPKPYTQRSDERKAKSMPTIARSLEAAWCRIHLDLILSMTRKYRSFGATGHIAVGIH